MRTIKMILPIALIAVALTACEKTLFNSIKGTGGNVTEMRTLAAFNSIQLSNDANVIYVQDSVFSLKLTGQANILAVLTTDVNNNELVIDYSKLVRKYNQVTIEVHAPSINGLTINGSGVISSYVPFSSEFLKLHISGSGNMDLAAVNVQQLESSISGSGSMTLSSVTVETQMKLRISGSGNMDLAAVSVQQLESSISGSGIMTLSSGTVETQTCTISGSGNMNMASLESQHVTAKISGSGSITVMVLESLDASISGSGNIRYYGTPAVVNTIINSGSGSVIHM